jgi:pectin methylesterase-like acyl-CoA thioesterase
MLSIINVSFQENSEKKFNTGKRERVNNSIIIKSIMEIIVIFGVWASPKIKERSFLGGFKSVRDSKVRTRSLKRL